MEFKKLFILLTCVIGLSSCATPYDVDIVKEDASMFKSHTTSAASQVDSKVQAISKLTFNCTDDTASCGAAKAMNNVLVSQAIAGIQAPEYQGKNHKTGLDVQDKAVEKVGDGIPIAGMTIVSRSAINKDKGTTRIDAKEGSEVSYEYREDHATSLGDGTAINTPGPAGGTVDTSSGHNTDDHSTTN